MKYSNLPVAESAGTDDKISVLQGGENKSVTVAQINQLANAHTDEIAANIEADLAGKVDKNADINMNGHRITGLPIELGEELDESDALSLGQFSQCVQNSSFPISEHHDDNTVPTTEAVDNFMTEEAEKLVSKSTKTTVTVNCPAYTNQPTIDGELNSAFTDNEYDVYFVNVLSPNTFNLMTVLGDVSTAIDQVFYLANLATGNDGALVQNTPINFLSIGANWVMRSGGVSQTLLEFINGRLNRYKLTVTGLCVPYYNGSAIFNIFERKIYADARINAGGLGTASPKYNNSTAVEKIKKYCEVFLQTNLERVEDTINFSSHIKAYQTDTIGASGTTSDITWYNFYTSPPGYIKNLDLTGFWILRYASARFILTNGTNITVEEIYE